MQTQGLVVVAQIQTQGGSRCRLEAVVDADSRSGGGSRYRLKAVVDADSRQ